MNDDEEAVLEYLRDALDVGESVVLRANRIERLGGVDAQIAGNWLSRMAGRETHTQYEPRPSPFEVSVYSENSSHIRWRVERGPPALTCPGRTRNGNWHHADPDNPAVPNCRLAKQRPETDWQETPYFRLAQLGTDGCRFCTGSFEPNKADNHGPTTRLAEAGLLGGDVDD